MWVIRFTLCHILVAAWQCVLISFPAFVLWSRSHPLLHFYPFEAAAGLDSAWSPGYCNHFIIQLVLKQWFGCVIDSTDVCEYAWTLAVALYLPCVRTQAINKHPVFFSCKSFECSETTCGHGSRQKRQTTRSAGVDEYTDKRERGVRSAKWESEAETEETLWERKKRLILLIYQPSSLLRWMRRRKLPVAVYCCRQDECSLLRCLSLVVGKNEVQNQ